jgi:outer membrane receptor protein involved in Fe transport
MTGLISKRGLAAALLAGTCLASIAAPALAQIEEIIVTTRKRAENLQEVPIVITAFTAEVLQRKGVEDLRSIAKISSGIQLDEGFAPQDQRVVIRGLSPTRGRPNVAVLQDDIDISSEALQTAGGSLLINPRLFDISRVEIVKGPHSALFGRSAFAGAINYITKKPGDKFEGQVDVEAGGYGKAEVKAGVSGPVIADVLSMGVNAAYWHFDGFYQNSITGGDIGGNDGKGVAASLLWKGSDNFKVTLHGEYSDDTLGLTARAVYKANLNEAVPANARTDVSPAVGGTPGRGFVVSSALLTLPIVDGRIPSVSAGGLVPRFSPDPRTGKDYTGTTRTIKRITGRIDAEFSGISVTSLTSYADVQTGQRFDAQGQGDINKLSFAAENVFDQRTRQASQELRIQNADPNDRINWTIGGLYWTELARLDDTAFTCFTGAQPLFCGPLVAAVGSTYPAAHQYWNRDTFHRSVYGIADVKLFGDLSATAEVRHTWETEHTSGPLFLHGIDLGFLNPAPKTGLNAGGCGPFPPAGFPLGCTFPEAAFNAKGKAYNSFTTPRAGLNYKISPDILAYVSASRGVKPGGISSVTGGAGGYDATLFSYLPEKMWVYEAGVKSSWLDNRLIANVAGYYQDFSDKQASTQVVLSTGILGTRIVNAAKARVYGMDAELAYAPNENWNFSLGYTLLDAKYGDYKVTTSGGTPIVRSANCTQVVTYRLPDGSSQTVTSPTALPAAGAVISGRSCVVDKSGHRLEAAPTHSLQFNALYKAPLAGEMKWLAEVSVQAQSMRYTDDDQRSFLPGFITADIRLGVEGARWSLIGYVDNLFDDDKIKSGFSNTDFGRLSVVPFPSPLTVVLPNYFQANLPDKRQFGVRAQYRF